MIMETNQPKPYDQAREEALADHVANSGGRSVYMQVDFDAGFSAGYNAALHDLERELMERAAIAAMQGILSNQSMTAAMPVAIHSEAAIQGIELQPEMVSTIAIGATAKLAIRYAETFINQLNTPQS